MTFIIILGDDSLYVSWWWNVEYTLVAIVDRFGAGRLRKKGTKTIILRGYPRRRPACNEFAPCGVSPAPAGAPPLPRQCRLPRPAATAVAAATTMAATAVAVAAVAFLPLIIASDSPFGAARLPVAPVVARAHRLCLSHSLAHHHRRRRRRRNRYRHRYSCASSLPRFRPCASRRPPPNRRILINN